MREKIRTLDKKIEKLKFKKILKKQKLQERGITLIALVVTIIILLILTGVTLNIALSDNGLFSKAKKATEEYKQAQNEEEDLLLKYEYEMAKLQGEISETETIGEYTMEKEIKEKYGQDIKIGDIVNYEPNAEGVEKVENYGGTWKVLGIEDGKILLMSSKPILYSYEWRGDAEILSGVSDLDNLCSKFGNGNGALRARCLRAEDINRITGYDPNGSDKFGKGTIYEYGIEVTLKKLDDGQVSMIGSNGVENTWPDGSFRYFDENGREQDFEGELKITNNVYQYLTESGITFTGGDLKTRNMAGSWGKLFGEYEMPIILANMARRVSPTFKNNYEPVVYFWMVLGRWQDRTYSEMVVNQAVNGGDYMNIKNQYNVSCVVVLNGSVKLVSSGDDEEVWSVVD